MEVISCECGVVLDKGKLKFPPFISAEGGGFDETLAGWDGNKWAAKTKFPVCGADILESA